MGSTPMSVDNRVTIMISKPKVWLSNNFCTLSWTVHSKRKHAWQKLIWCQKHQILNIYLNEMHAIFFLVELLCSLLQLQTHLTDKMLPRRGWPLSFFLYFLWMTWLRSLKLSSSSESVTKQEGWHPTKEERQSWNDKPWGSASAHCHGE